MSQTPILDQAIAQISRGDLGSAIDFLVERFPNSRYKNELVNLAGKNATVNDRLRQELISFTESDEATDKIRMGVLQLIDYMKEEASEAQTQETTNKNEASGDTIQGDGNIVIKGNDSSEISIDVG